MGFDHALTIVGIRDSCAVAIVDLRLSRGGSAGSASSAGLATMAGLAGSADSAGSAGSAGSASTAGTAISPRGIRLVAMEQFPGVPSACEQENYSHQP